MIDLLFKEKVISKCFAISSWAAKRGRSTLNHEQKEFERADKILDVLVEQLMELVKTGEVLIETKEEDVWNE